MRGKVRISCDLHFTSRSECMLNTLGKVKQQKQSVSTPTKNRGLTAMFDQPCQRGHLPLNPETLTIENKPVTISGDPSK